MTGSTGDELISTEFIKTSIDVHRYDNNCVYLSVIVYNTRVKLIASSCHGSTVFLYRTGARQLCHALYAVDGLISSGHRKLVATRTVGETETKAEIIVCFRRDRPKRDIVTTSGNGNIVPRTRVRYLL
jgi:hypothetical protein